MELETNLVSWTGEENRPIAMTRPCYCGCGSRDGFDEGVGNLSGSNEDGQGFTLFIYDEDTFRLMSDIFGER